MILDTTLRLLAATVPSDTATGTREESLGVTATVIRPVEISPLSIGSEGGVVTLRNSAAVEVSATGATVSHPDADTAIVTGERAGPVAITITS